MTALDQTVACAPHKAHLAVLRGQPQEVIPQIVLLTLPQLPYGHKKSFVPRPALVSRPSQSGSCSPSASAARTHAGIVHCTMAILFLYCDLSRRHCAMRHFRQDRRSGLGARNALVPFGIFDQPRPTSLCWALSEQIRLLCQNVKTGFRGH